VQLEKTLLLGFSLVMIAMSIGLAGEVKAEDWFEVGQSDDGSSHFLNRDSIQEVNEGRRFLTEQTQLDGDRVRSEMIVDCSNSRIKATYLWLWESQATEYNAAGAPPPEYQSWLEIPPGSIISLLADEVCH
jgi:hypothetical protein